MIRDGGGKASTSSGYVRFSGSASLRSRIVLSVLSGRPLRVDHIREEDRLDPGLRDYEVNLFRLVEEVTNGTVIEINESGTSFRMKPGVVIGGTRLQHDCVGEGGGGGRCISWYLEPLVLLSLFARKPLSIRLRGVTNSARDPGVDVWRQTTLPLLRKLGLMEEGDFELNIVKRGTPPDGMGEVMLRTSVPKHLPTIKLIDEGLVKRVRGTAYAVRLSPQFANRMVDGCRGVLNNLIPDVYIFTDHSHGGGGGGGGGGGKSGSPAYGIALTAETTAGSYVSSTAVQADEVGAGDSSSSSSSDKERILPEDLGKRAAHILLEEIKRGGAVDSTHQNIVLMLAALGPRQVSRIRFGPLTPSSIRTLRDIRSFLRVTFRLLPEPETMTIVATCIGSGLNKVAKRSY